MGCSLSRDRTWVFDGSNQFFPAGPGIHAASRESIGFEGEAQIGGADSGESSGGKCVPTLTRMTEVARLHGVPLRIPSVAPAAGADKFETSFSLTARPPQ